MKKQQQSIFLILFLYFIQTHCAVITHWNKIQPKNKNLSQTNLCPNCLMIEDDEDVVTSDEFNIPLNPISRNSKSYGSTYKNGHIFHLNIVKKTFIPSTIFCLKYLKRLEIRKTCFSPCNLQEIPSHIECLASSLTELSIYDTTITQLPEQIGKLKGLEVLKLSNTGLTSLPDSVGDLSSLTMLYLPNNKLTSLPITIENLQSLQQIILSNNPYLHSVQPLNGLPALRILDTRRCSIEILPQNIPQLTDLYMSNNNLTNLNDIETLGSETNSKNSFYFNNNYIKSIPPQIRQVKNLFRLTLNHNQLKNLPTDIFTITTLSYLNIQHNNFSHQDLNKIVSNFHHTIPNLKISYK